MKQKNYDEFVEKFKPKKTTDDCYTPPKVYEAIKNWVVEEYKLQGKKIIRPFYPEGDFENYEYSEDCVVIDNPPFSIYTKIVRWYLENNIKFFLFAPNLTLFSNNNAVCHIITSIDITYDNGAVVNTSFSTNMDKNKVRSAKRLRELIEEANYMDAPPPLVSHVYPDHVITAGKLSKLAEHGVEFSFKAEDCHFIRAMDEQKAYKKTMYGAGYLISDKKAQEQRELEEQILEYPEKRKSLRERPKMFWQVSEREKEIIKTLG